MSTAHGGYYIPHGTTWPIMGSIGLTTLVVGAANYLNGSSIGMPMMMAGLGITLLMMFGWFGTVIRESESGIYNDQVDKSFRWGMSWFIFSEDMSVPWLGGEDATTNQLLWNGWEAAWPTNGPGDIGGKFETMGAWGIPALNTLLLLTSGVTVTLAHWALKKQQRGALVFWLFATVVLGFTFLGFQIKEYVHAYHELNLTLGSGIYGSTFFMLTGFHGMRVTIGAIMLTIIMLRCMKGHFTPDRHFAFEGVAWYWHFVDVVWLGLFIFVYIL